MFLRVITLALLIFGSASAEIQRGPVRKYLDSNLTVLAPQDARFPIWSVGTKDYVKLKEAEWKGCRRTRVSQVQLFSQSKDKMELFLEAPVTLRTLEQIEKKNLKKSQLQENPWSGDYWAIANGTLGARYMNQDFIENYSWIGKFEYVKKNPAPFLIEQKGQEAIPILSPAEKYDLLTGNLNYGFTSSQWAQGQQYYDETGDVEGWMGICHGWAPAAIVEPRPQRSVDIQSFDQEWSVHFNPSEIKGLISYSWATNPFPVVTLGSRCNKKEPNRDENGRITDPECFDLNPSTWHLSIVHMMGQQNRSFVMDATFDYEVWNQPVIGYSYKYFNPKTKQLTEDLSEATVERSQHTGDIFSKYRSPQTKFIVGILMKVGYVVESGANTSENDSAENDNIRWVNYKYDLELDEKRQIIGGEWHQEAHPDFIWTPKNGARPLSQLDYSLNSEDWVDGSAIPNSWSKASRVGGSRGIILNAVTQGILKRSHE